ncbi:hypothetical protein A4G18_00585 [Pasteurellaceae bacterium Pebbles2]|nr:hypothetical protein [Pasteurellaceae bacterium Pebbles2]
MKESEILKTITPQILADYLNAKGANMDTFKCPICGSEHIAVIDNQPFDVGKGQVEIKSTGKAMMQAVLPTILYPRAADFNQYIESGKIESQFHYLGNFITHMSAANAVTLPVIHIICDNCGNVRTFDKAKILDWLKQQRSNANE